MIGAGVLVPLAIAGAALSPAIGGHADAARAHAAASKTAPISLGAESWYQSPQLCLISSLCLPIASPLAQTYPAGTLHIAAAAGNESARTYLSLRKPLSKTETIRGGLLRLVLDTNPIDGSITPDLAKVEACTTQAKNPIVNGATTKPPAIDCADAPTSRVIGTPATELDINLHAIAARLARPHTSIALLPVLSVGATFNVTLSSDQRPKSSSSTPVLILTTAAKTAATPSVKPTTTPTPQPTQSSVGGGGGGGGTVDDGGGSVPIPTGPIDTGPQASTMPDNGGSQPQIAPRSKPEAIQLVDSAHGFDYPVVFLLPLLILAGLFGLGRQLTRPLTSAGALESVAEDSSDRDGQ